MPKADPQRSCLGCREVRPKNELLRFVLDPEGTLLPDIARKLPGRGSYTCFCRDCLETALKRKQFNRSFNDTVKLLPEPELISIIVKVLEEKISSLISLANKAGKAVSGSDKVMDTLRKGEAAILILAAVAIFLWVKIFPKTKIGHRMTVSTDLADAKATAPHLPGLIGKRGTAACELKPGGFAMIENRKVDVITRGEMIARGEAVEVVKVEGCRVVVQRCGQ